MIISVIIPVYNGEKYLKKCVDSVLQQTHRELECILIDDQSTDYSLEICREYQKSDNRIKVICQKNAGTSAARNTGLKAATGNYVMFLDQDDYWESLDAVSEIVNLLIESKAEVLMFNTKTYYENKDIFTGRKDTCKRSEIVGKKAGKVLHIILGKGLMHRAVWAKVVERNLILRHEIWFPEGRRNEDTAWTAKLIRVADSYDWYEKVFYVYRRGTSISQTAQPLNREHLNDLKTILTESIALGKKIEDSDLQEAYYSYLAFPFAVWLGYSMKMQLFKAVREMKVYAQVLKYDIDIHMKSLSKLYKYGGYYITAIALLLWVRFNR